MGQSYTTGGDSLQRIGHNWYAAQTFTPQVTHTLNCIDINLRTVDPLRAPTYWVYLADAQHKPTGDYLSKSLVHSADDWNVYDVFRARAVMSPTLLSAGIEYVIVIHSFALISAWHQEWQYDNNDATYPRGLRLISNDFGATWTPHPGDDHMFAEFGTAPLPPPPPPPPTTKWLIVSITQTLTATGYIIVVTTNVPCHLWMRWTTVVPKEHLIQRTKRGLPLMLEKYFCVDVYEDNEQEETGDTTEHTFIKEPWPICETRYFYFHGEVAGTPSPSTSTIFKKHRITPPPAPITVSFYPDPHPEVSSVDGFAMLTGPNSDWVPLVNGNGNIAIDSLGSVATDIYCGNAPNKFTRLVRGMIVFDTRSIPAGATFVSAKVELLCFAKEDGIVATPGYVLSPFNPASMTAIVAADYQTVVNTVLTDVVPWAALIPGNWNTYNFNAAGLATLTPEAWTKLAVRAHPYDILAIQPPWLNNAKTKYRVWDAETILANRAKLTVTYLP